MIIDFAPFVNDIVLPITGTFLLALATWGMQQLAARLHLKQTEALQKLAEQAMQNGLAYAQSKIGALPMTADTKHEFVAVAAGYAMDQAQKELTRLGVTGGMLAQKLEARLSLNTTPPESSAAVPTPAIAPTPIINVNK